LVGFLRIASLYFIFLFFIFGKKDEFWGITQNWVMTDDFNNPRVQVPRFLK
jgi:hypothetical protein